MNEKDAIRVANYQRLLKPLGYENRARKEPVCNICTHVSLASCDECPCAARLYEQQKRDEINAHDERVKIWGGAA